MRVHRLLVVALVASMFPLGAGVASAEPPSFAGRFIVTLADEASSPAVAAEYRRNGAAVDHVYTAALNGFAGAMSDANLQSLRSDHRVVRIERDGIATASDIQSNATWGLDRIDQTNLPVDTKYRYDRTGAGVTAYIVDTGILATHTNFGGRAVNKFDALGGNGTDCDGHGTHVAGTVGSATYGVAKAVQLVGIRVLDCNGSGAWSGVIAGLDWVRQHAVAPAVVNMSLGGGAIASVDDAVNGVIGAGITVVVAAGNGNKAGIAQDACNYSPSRVAGAITVGSTTNTDAKSSWSNYGSCVDLFAPGSSIKSTWYSSNTATSTISGTSMASPHVAGVAALYLQQAPTATPSTVASAIAGATTKGVVTSSNTTNNNLLYSLITAPVVVETGTVSGVVTAAASGEAIIGASVSASGVTTTSDLNGSYSLTLPAGPHTVTASSTGYVAGTQSATVAPGGTATASFSLVAEDDSPPTSPTITLSLTVGTRKKNVTPVTATWTDSTAGSGQQWDVWANGSIRETTSSDTSVINWRGTGTVTYKVCRTGGTTVCSEEKIGTIV